jgi:hypothetical protein
MTAPPFKSQNALVKKTSEPAAISGSKPVAFAVKPRNANRERAMAKFDFGYLPRGNPCAQCGKPIAAPEWIEQGPRRISYLWHCRACDYRFEAVAFFDDSNSDSEPLAA